MKFVRIILLIINIIAALALILSTLAGVVPPSRTILPSVAAYAFPLLLILNTIAALAWLLARKWHCLISIGAIALRWSFVGFFFQFPSFHTSSSAARPSGDAVTLMSYNVHNLSGPEFEYSPNDSIALHFLALVRREMPDVLCLQEYCSTRGVALTDSLQLLGYNHHYASSGKPDRPSGTAVFSRLPITYVKRIDGLKVMVELMHGQRPLRLLCVHMDSYSFTARDREEIEQMRRGHLDSTSHPTLRKAKQTVLKHETEWRDQLQPIVTECTVPLVVAGDMNDIPGSWLYARMTEHLTDSYRQCGTGFGSTYHGGFPQFRIDMVLHNDQLRTTSYRRLRTKISDHYPLIVTLQPATP